MLTAGLLGSQTATAKPNVERVSFTPRSDGQGYVVRFHVDGPIGAYAEPRRVAGDQIEMILFNTGISKRYRRDEPMGPISSYAEESSGGHLVFRFTIDSNAAVVASAYRDRESEDVLLGLTYSDGALAGSSDSQHSVPIRRVSTAVIEAGDETLYSSQSDGHEAPSAAELGSSPRQDPESGASSEATQWLLDTVVIDAGHGGKDPGAADNGVVEKDITLGVALKLGEYLRDLLGVNVVYTRSDDRFIELKDRGKIANAHGGKLFISIHVNAAANSSAIGAETYFLGMHKSDAARNTMERENSVVMLESSQSHYEDMTEEALIRMELTQSAYMRKSQQLSGIIQEQFEERVNRRNRGVKQAGFYVLWGASMPAVLVELGFLTNPREARFLRSEQGQDYMASAIYRAVRTYKEQYEKGLSRIAVDQDQG